MKKVVAILGVFVTWEVLDYLIHNVMLRSAYEATASMWRPEGEMKLWVMFVTVLISAFAFVMLYDRLVAAKGPGKGLVYGLWFGLATGVSMGYGTYAVMPIPYSMAFTWFAGALIESAVGGLVLGAIMGNGGRAAPSAA